MKNGSFNSEGMSRRSILEGLAGGGMFAGLNSLFTQQAAADMEQVVPPFDDDTDAEDMDIDPEEAVGELADTLVNRFYNRFLNEVQREYGDSLNSIYTDLSGIVDSIPEDLEILNWLDENLDDLRDAVWDKVKPDEDNDGNENVSTAPVEIVGSTVDGSSAVSGSTAPSSSGLGDAWDDVKSQVESLGSALGDYWGDLTDNFPQLDDYFNADELADVINDVTLAIEDAVDALLHQIANVFNPLHELFDIFNSKNLDKERLRNELTSGFNITGPLNGPDQNLFVESLTSVVADEEGSPSNSLGEAQGFSTSQSPSSGTESKQVIHQQELENEIPDDFSLSSLINFDGSTATMDPSEVRGGHRGLSSATPVPDTSPNSQPICGEFIESEERYNGLSGWSSYVDFAQDSSGKIITEAVNNGYQGFGSYDADPVKPCPAAPGGVVRTVGLKVALSDADEVDEVPLTDPSTVIFFGIGNDGCLYGGVDPSLAGGQYAEHVSSAIEGSITWALYLKNQLDSALQDVGDYAVEEFCTGIDNTGNSDDDTPTIYDLENDVRTIYDTLEESLDEIIRRSDGQFAFTDSVQQEGLENMVSSVTAFEVPIDDDDAPDLFSLSSDSISRWREYALGGVSTQGQIDDVKSALSSDSIYADLARLYNNVDADSEFDSDDIPTALEDIATDAQELTNDSPDWSSVPLSVLCASSQELQEIADFIQTDVDQDHVPPSIDEIIENEDSSLKSAYKVANGLMSTYIKHQFVYILYNLCERLVSLASMEDLGKLKQLRTLAKVVEAVRFIEGTTICGRVGCQRGSSGEPYPTGLVLVAYLLRNIELPDIDFKIPEIRFPNPVEAIRGLAYEVTVLAALLVFGLILLAGYLLDISLEVATGPVLVSAIGLAILLPLTALWFDLAQESILLETFAGDLLDGNSSQSA
ncbi:hypothetical protein EGH22_04620 [Halomicroarcula sp. F28]|uniref:hypothetical protein n=1 Tax=Haloarcula salinisoli TaxID=2487746 RepID=UPI001C732E62|nr:hypothetical protein [Halomicroarcula salinisoli]MBX0285598.1 hypothetical protein [Halomicroarcula salinisoli]